MAFGSESTPRGSYCLEAVSSGCEKPYSSSSSTKITAVSTSGAPSEDYCGIAQGVTCEAILDTLDPADAVRCSDSNNQPDDGLCGCHRDASGKCTDKGLGGLCRQISSAYRCTIPCSLGANCIEGYSCVSASDQNYCG
jgi:hypothetical protein